MAIVAGFLGGRIGDRADEQAGAPQPEALPPASGAPATLSGGTADLGVLYRRVAPSVVQIVTAGRSPRPDGAGSGVIVDGSGSILTNDHVVSGDRATVVLADGRRLDARVAGRDPQWDLAVVRIEDPPAGLAPARLGDSGAVAPGQTVFAIGAPFGLRGSLTIGVVSAVNRTFGAGRDGRPMRGLIQTDAAVNPGNSGGPLFDAAGEVIGITTAIESPVRGSVGVAFAVPIAQAQRSLPTLVRGDTVEHPFLGIQGQPAVGGGVEVLAITPGSSATASDLRVGDVITAIAGRRVEEIDELAAQLDRHRVGETVTLTVRRDDETLSLQVALRAYQEG